MRERTIARCVVWEGMWMSQSRVVILCIAIGLSALVVNSLVAFVAGLTPAIFQGVVFHVLAAACSTCWLLHWVAVRVDRRERLDRAERVRNFSTAVRYTDGDGRSTSGSWRRARPST